MTKAERIAIFRPQVVLAQRTAIERYLTKRLLNLQRGQFESIRMQLRLGARRSSIVLDRRIVSSMAEALAQSLKSTFKQGKTEAKDEIARARLTHKADFSAVDYVPGPEDWQDFYPKAALDWYQDYALRIVGVQQADILESAKDAIRLSIQAGEAQGDMMNRLDNVFGVLSQPRLENIARTETAKIYSQARMQEFENDDEIVGYELCAVMDTRTSPICRARDGKSFPKDQLEGNNPPFHYMCRTEKLPIFSWEVEAGSFEYDPIPKGAPPVLDGFGTKSMAIPKPSRQAKTLIKSVSKVM